MSQTKLADVCKQIVLDVEGALGCALVDLTTGLPLALAVKPASLLGTAAMEVMSALGVTYFSGNTAGRFGPDSSAETGGHPTDMVQEIQATTEETYHFMSLVPGAEQELLILILDRAASNLGLGWMSMRHALELVGDLNGHRVSRP